MRAAIRKSAKEEKLMKATPVEHTIQNITARPFEGDDDFWKVRDLLIETYRIAPPGHNWEIRRWDGQRFHHENARLNPRWGDTVRLWETEDGQLVGVAHPEGEGNAFLELHPDYRFIEDDLIAWAEAHLSVPTENGQQRQLTFDVFDYDALRQRLLAARGFEQMPWGGYWRRMRLAQAPLPPVRMAADYTLRTTRPNDTDDCQRIADLLNAAFGRDCHTGQELANFYTHAPCFRHDLDLVAEAPDGSFAAYVGVILDEANRFGIFEPVCTHPDHQRNGLARTLMIEGLHRLKALDTIDAHVGTGDMKPANRLYDSVGFAEKYRLHAWRKVW
jgi:mycothiol synthase